VIRFECSQDVEMAIDGQILAAEIERMLRARRYSVAEVAARFGMTRWQVYAWARKRGLPLRGRWLTAEEKVEIIRLVERQGLPIKRAAAKAGVGRMQAWRLIQNHRDQLLAEATEDLVPKKLAEPRRCPRHGLVRLWPCVACAAEGLQGNTHHDGIDR
jgi:transposase-like protein